MPFERYLGANEEEYQYDYNENTGHGVASSSLSAMMEMPDSRVQSPVRLHMPQFLQTGAPMLAPGGGAEVLPVGLFTSNTASNTAAGASSAWFANNGITTSFSFDNRQPSKTYVYPSQYQEPSKFSPSNISPSSSSPFDYDYKPTSSTAAVENQSHEATKVPSPTTLSMQINSGLINPQHRLTPNQLSSIGVAGAAAGSTTLNAPSPLGLPVYSTSGFDLLSVLARVAARPDPKVALGPVDLSTSFCVSDVRRYDEPIIYCSPTFCRLTGYPENEIIGKNCRFLQSPNGVQPKGEYRRFTSSDAVAYLKKHLAGNKECQTSIINYKKNGDAFINLVTVIPIKGGDIGAPQEDDQVIYHVGFQVDLTEQPNAILEKVKEGSYIANYAANNPVSIIPPQPPGPGTGSSQALFSRDRKGQSIPSPVIAKEFKKLLDDPSFLAKYPISTAVNVDASASVSALPAPVPSISASDSPSDLVNVGTPGNNPLSMLLLEYAPDFVHVVSLKGTFLYVGPSVRRVLGYGPEELVGKALSDICHPADIVPLMRELKESSATGSTAPANNEEHARQSPHTQQPRSSSYYHEVKPRSVDMLYRARTKAGQYVWVECRGRLHVEPGKGRKAIMLSGRAKEMSMLKWSAVSSAGGLSYPRSVGAAGEDSSAGTPGASEVFTEFWGTLTRTGSLLVVGKGVKDVLGWDTTELMGRQIWGYVLNPDARQKVGDELANMGCALGSADAPGSLPSKIFCRMLRKDGSSTEVEMVLYPSAVDTSILHSKQTISPAPVIYQIKLHQRFDYDLNGRGSGSGPSAAIMHPLEENVFKELEIVEKSSWQYELQQLRYANDRLREEIRVMEGQEEPAQQQQQPSDHTPPSLTASSSSSLSIHVNSKPTVRPTSSAMPISPIETAYDHHLLQDQGLGSTSLNSSLSDNLAQNQIHSSMYNTMYAQPQAWAPTTPTAVSMPMHFAQPAPRYDSHAQSHQQPCTTNSNGNSANPLKRTWEG